MKTFIIAISTSALITGGAIAAEKKGPPPGSGRGGEGPRPDPAEIFKKLDTNGDGAVSLEEFQAGPRAQKDPARAEELFKKIDTDGSGTVSGDEFKAHRPPHGPGDGEGRPPKRGEGEGGKRRGPGGADGAGPGGGKRGPRGPGGGPRGGAN